MWQVQAAGCSGWGRAKAWHPVASQEQWRLALPPWAGCRLLSASSTGVWDKPVWVGRARMAAEFIAHCRVHRSLHVPNTPLRRCPGAISLILWGHLVLSVQRA